MTRRTIAVVTAAAALTGALAASGIVLGQGDSGAGERLVAGEIPDASPRAAPRVAARAPAAGGGDIAVATYRNNTGRLCAAFGQAQDDELRDRRGRQVPFDQAGNCTLHADPVAVQVVQRADDPVTAVDERSVVIWGLAADTIDAIQVTLGDGRASMAPGRDGAFIASLPPRQDNVVLTLSSSDGAHEQLTLPPPPDLAELNRRLRQHAASTRTSHGHP